jgi:anaerobic selenocysteine-containing dehydrogenase
MVEVTRSFCRNCAALCGILVHRDGDRVVKIRGDREHPLSQGYTCAKGRALDQVHHDPERIYQPARDFDGERRDTDWDDCLDDLAAKLTRVIDEHGPDSVAVFLGAGAYYDAGGYATARAFPRAIESRSLYSDMSIDTVSKAVVADLVGGFAGFLPRPDHERAEFLLYIGANPVVSHGQFAMTANPVATIRAIAKRGEVWVIDPRETKTARLATRHLSPRPGSDYAILAHLARELLRNVDAAALARRATGITELTTALEPFDLSTTARLSGLTGEDLESLVDAVSRAGRIAIETGTGVSMSPASSVTEWLAWVVLVLSDSIDRPGGVWCHPGFFAPLDGSALPLSPPEGSRAAGPSSRSELPGVLGELPAAALPDEIASGAVRALLCIGGNPVGCLPGTEKTVSALEGLDVLACFDILNTPTTDLATHVLPNKDQLERPDLSILDALYSRVSAQYTPAAVAAADGCRSLWWTLVALAERLGRTLVRGIDSTNTDEDMLAKLSKRSRCGIDEMRSRGLVTTDIPLTGWLDAHLERLGGWRLAPIELLERLEQLKDLEPQEGLILISGRQSRHLNSRFADLGDRPDVFISPQDADLRALGDGDSVRVSSEYGELVAAVRIDSTLPESVLSIGHGWSAVNVNRLTSGDNVDRLSGMPVFSSIPVELRAA